MQLTQKIRIFLTAEQQEVLWKLSERCRLLYNFALAERRESWEKTGKSVKKSRQNKDFQHKLSKLVENTRANTIAVGNLSVKQMARSKGSDGKRDKGLHRAIQNNGYLSRFAGFLTYKARLAGKRVIEISEKDTTKTCCACGKKHDMKVWDRVMKCDCGNVMGRDRNSAVNIMMRLLSQKASVNRLLSFRKSILRQTGLAIASYSQEAPCEAWGSSHLS